MRVHCFSIIIGDLSSASETKSIAYQVNKLGRMDAVIHNAGIYLERKRSSTSEGHAKTLAVNFLTLSAADRDGGPNPRL